MKRGKSSLFFQFIIIFTMSLIITSCSQDDTARVTIDLDSNGLAAHTTGPGYIDRIVNFITMSRDADAAAPSGLTSFQLTVTGPGMSTITEEYPVDTARITLDIPSGKERVITLTADLDPSVVVNFKSYTGSAYLDLKSGEVRRITLTMAPTDTKIVIPDYRNRRIVQIDDMNGTNWKTLTGNSFTGISLEGSATKIIYPYDVAFDARGRIYISNNTTNSPALYTNLYRIDSIPSSGTIPATEIISGKDVERIKWIAIDIKNSILYFTAETGTVSSLWKSDLDGNNRLTLISLAAGNLIYGINVDDDGNVYVAYSNYGTVNMVAKYDPASFSAPVATFNLSTYYPMDVTIKGKNVFVAVASASKVIAGKKIVLLNTDLQFIDEYGSGSTGTAPGNFLGPRHFVATLNRKLYILDDGGYDEYFYEYDKLVSMDDIDGTNWSTYGTRGAGTGQFDFYYYC